MKIKIVIPLIAASIGLATVSRAEQKIIFTVESISYKSGTDSDTQQRKCQAACSTKGSDASIDSFILSGWKIVSASPKDVIGSEYFVDDTGRYAYGCTCKGNQYVLQKDEPASVSTVKELELLTKENELLKRENALLKQENDTLKSKKKKK